MYRRASGSDAILVSCGSLRTLEIVEALERDTGKSVVSSNIAQMWTALRMLGMAGAERPIFERVLPILKAYGDQIIRAGDVGAGCICKLVHQLIGAGCTQAIAEGLTLGGKAGVDVKVVWDSVRRGLVSRMQMLHEQVPESVFTGMYEPTVFTLTLLRKDVGLAMKLARQHCVPAMVGSIAEQVLTQALNRGWENGAGYTVTYRLQEEAAGVSLRASGVDPAKAAKYISTDGEVDAYTDEGRGGLRAAAQGSSLSARAVNP